MKPFDQLTETELIALTEEELNRYIDLKCAEEGVKLLPTEAPKPPKMDPCAADAIVYTVGSFSFFDRKDAERIVAQLAKCSLAKTEYLRNGYKTDYNRQTAVPEYELPTVSEKSYHSPEHAARHAQAIALYNEQKEAYEKANREYTELTQQRAKIAQEYLDAIREARTTSNKRATLMKEYERYMQLAEQNKGVALRFLRLAHTDAPEVLFELYANDELLQAEEVVNGIADMSDVA